MALAPQDLLQFLGGGSRSSASSSLNAVISPSFNISTAGPASGSAGGTATGSASSSSAGNDGGLPSFLPTGNYGSAPLPQQYDIDGPAAIPAGIIPGDLLDNPILLIGGAVVLFLLLGGKGKF